MTLVHHSTNIFVGLAGGAAAIAALALGVPTDAAGQNEHDHDGHSHEGPRHLHGHDGFPAYVDIFFTHHAYLERKLHPRFDATWTEIGNAYQESAELVWQFGPWLGAEVAGLYGHTDPEEGDGVSGFGDIEVAPMVAFLRDPERLLTVSFRSGFVLPTGDEEEGLGIDGWGWEPGLLVWKGFGAEKRGALQAELTYDRLFADHRADHEELIYNLGLSWWLPSNWIPIAELNGATRISDVEEEHEEEVEELPLLFPARRDLVPAHGEIGAGEEETSVSATLGFRYAFGNGQQWGAGIQLPLTDTEAYDIRLVVGGIVHLP